MKTETREIANCWYCDNLIEHPEQVGLLYLGFPRAFVLIPNSYNLYESYEQFASTVQFNWLDHYDKGDEQERERILTLLWNFSVLQEREEGRLHDELEEEKEGW